MSYYNYASLFPAGQAQDRVRGSKVPSTPIELNTLEEAFRYDAVAKTCVKSKIADLLCSSENYIIRLYRVKKPDNVGRDHQSAVAFDKGQKKKRAKNTKKGVRILREE